MGIVGITVAIAVGLFLAALAYGINIFDIFLVDPVAFALLAVTVAGIVLVVAGRRRR
ncbi:MAG TPA: hypothetical protein VMW56_00580 [Candidatus Margulisiibacteriota bacterium]|nr:hypothetical protein [Candidatus Margulisiibacteriota bacterium]